MATGIDILLSLPLNLAQRFEDRAHPESLSSN